jgi:copper chaperone CopZ
MNMTVPTLTRNRTDRRKLDSMIKMIKMTKMITMIRMILLSSLFQLTLVGCGDARDRDSTTVVNRQPAETFVIGVTGMHCDGCAEAITAKVTKIDGVTTCEADWERGTTTVLANPDAIPTIQDSIARMGFTVEDAVVMDPTDGPGSTGESTPKEAEVTDDHSSD